MSKSLAEFRRPEAAEENQIVFPAACTSEKLFARSERRRSRQGPRRKRSESPLAEKASAFFDKFSVVCYQDLGLPALRELAHDLRRQAQLPQLRPQGGGLVPGQGDEQPAGGLGVEEDLLHGEGHAVELHEGAGVVAVALAGGGEQELVGVVQGLGDHRHPLGVDMAGQLPVQHLVEVAQEAEAGDVGAGVNVVAPGPLRGVLVQGGHGLDRRVHGLRAGLLHPVGGADDAHPQPLGQDQGVAGAAPVVGVDPVRMDNAHDGQAVLHVAVGDGVAPRQDAPGLDDLLRAALHDLPQDVQIHGLREADDVQGGLYLTAHGVDVAEGIGGRDLAEGVGVLHHGWEEVQGLDDGDVVGHLVHGGVVLAVVADEQIFVLRAPGQQAQHPAEDAGAQLGGAPAALTELDLLCHYGISCLCESFIYQCICAFGGLSI